MAWKNSREDLNVYTQGEIDRWVYSTCNICSNGCGCFVAVKDDQIVGIKGNKQYPTNQGRLGPKGENQWWANNSTDRLTSPLIRNKQGVLVKASWDDALALLVEKTTELVRHVGPKSLGFYHTGQAYLEEYYTIAKVMKAGLGMHNIDANTRLCTATAEWSLIQSFGSDGPPACMEDIDRTEVIVIIGLNMSETNTVMWERVLEAKRNNGTKLIVIDPRQTLTQRFADLSLYPKSGTNVALLNGIVHLLITHGWIDSSFIEKHTIGFDSLRNTVGAYRPEVVESITGVSKEELYECARLIGTSQSTLTLLLQGVYQSMDATPAATLVNSMHLIMGKIGKPGSGPFQQDGQPSAMSNREVGGAAFYPGYRNSSNPNHIREMEELWNLPYGTLPVGPVTHIMNMLELIENGTIQMMWVMATNPVVTLPNRDRVIKLLKKVFLVVQDPFLSETAELADLVLPTALWGEKEGTMTNLERRVNVLRKAVPAPSGLPSDFELLLEFSRRMNLRERHGKPLITYQTPEEAFNEWKLISKGRPCDMSGMTYEKMEELGGIQWPCNEHYPLGKKRLYTDGHFHTNVDDAHSYGKLLETGRARTRKEFKDLEANGRAILYGFHWTPAPEHPNEEYPFSLNNGRLVYHWHTRTKTGRAPILQMAAPEAYAEIHPIDAKTLSLETGDYVRITTKRGSISVFARIVDSVMPGSVFIPFHYGALTEEEAANILTVDIWDQVSKQPRFKAGACKVEKLLEKK